MNSQLLSRFGVGLLSLAVAAPVLAAGPAMEATEKQSLNLHAIAMFFVFVLLTLGITYWAAGKSKTASDFYTAGGGISGDIPESR